MSGSIGATATRHAAAPLIAGTAIALLVALTVSIAAIGLPLGITVGAATLPLAAALTIVAVIVLFRHEPVPSVAAGIVLAALLAVASIAVAGALFDVSYDGNSYQKAAIGALAHGWNPLREGIDAYHARFSSRLSPITHALWIDHYPKASWLFGAAVYRLTGSIETAKGINLVMAAACALVIFHELRERRAAVPAAAAVSLLTAANPISLPQFASTYVDGLLASTLFIIITMLLSLSEPNRRRAFDTARWTLLAAAIVVCANIKFTGLVYAGFFCGSFYVLWLVRAARGARLDGVDASNGARSEHPLKSADMDEDGAHPTVSAVDGTADVPAASETAHAVEQTAHTGVLGRTFLHLTGFYLVIVVFSVAFVGASPYIANTLDHGSPFYPLISPQKVDIIDSHQPDSFETMNPYEKFALVLFSRTENASKEPVTLKAPFTAEPSELAVSGYDTRRAGFGAWSSGIFLISAAVCAGGALSLALSDRRTLASVGALVVPAIALIGMTDGSWWARYTPYLWLLPAFALAILLNGPRSARSRTGRARLLPLIASRAAGIALAALVIADLVTFAPAITAAADAGGQARAFADQIRAAGGPLEVTLDDDARGGSLYDVLDTGIEYTYVTNLDGEAAYNLKAVGIHARTVGHR